MALISLIASALEPDFGTLAQDRAVQLTSLLVGTVILARASSGPERERYLRVGREGAKACIAI